jgi:hypothetical protein
VLQAALKAPVNAVCVRAVRVRARVSRGQNVGSSSSAAAAAAAAAAQVGHLLKPAGAMPLRTAMLPPTLVCARACVRGLMHGRLRAYMEGVRSHVRV